MKTFSIFAPCALLSLALFANACEQPTPPRAPMALETMEPTKPLVLLETYEVQGGDSDRLGDVLQRVLQEEGKVEVLPNKALLVAAPAHVHEGIAEFITHGPKLEDAPRQVVVLDYWLVLGTTTDELLEQNSAHTKRLEVLSKELDVIRKSEGYEHFTLLDHVKLSTLDGEDGSSQSLELAEVRQTVSARADLFEARIDVKTRLDVEQSPRDLETTIRLKAGESMVLGQAGYERQGVKGAVFYVVRAALQE